jgi:hypothetical protein
MNYISDRNRRIALRRALIVIFAMIIICSYSEDIANGLLTSDDIIVLERLDAPDYVTIDEED